MEAINDLPADLNNVKDTSDLPADIHGHDLHVQCYNVIRLNDVNNEIVIICKTYVFFLLDCHNLYQEELTEDLARMHVVNTNDFKTENIFCNFRKNAFFST